MSILVTGVAGQLGRALAETLGDRAVTPTEDALDVTDAAAVGDVVAGLRPAAIVNAAAMTDVDACESNPARAHEINALGAANVARAAARSGAFLVHVSTDFVFDGRLDRPYREEDEPNPLSVYGSSKLEGERLARAEWDRVAVVRTAWLYGPWGGNFVGAILKAAGRDHDLKVVFDQVGSPTWVRDLARAIVALVDRPVAGVFHTAGSGSCSRYEFARAILAEAGLDPERVKPVSTAEVPRPARRPAFAPLEGAAWRRAGFPPLRPWREALREAIAEIARASGRGMRADAT